MKRIIFTIFLIIFLVFVIKPWRWHVHVFNGHHTLAQRLHLTTQQVEYEKMLRKENQQEIDPILHKLEIENKRYYRLIDEKADPQIIIREKEVMNNLSNKYVGIQKEHMVKFEGILTKEQRDKFKRIRTQLFLND